MKLRRLTRTEDVRFYIIADARRNSMTIIDILIVGFFITLGILFGKGKGLSLIAGYNTLPREEQEKYDTKALARCMGKMMFALAGGWCVLGVGVALDRMWLFWVGFALFLSIVVFFAIYMNTNNRFKR